MKYKLSDEVEGYAALSFTRNIIASRESHSPFRSANISLAFVKAFADVSKVFSEPTIAARLVGVLLPDFRYSTTSKVNLSVGV